MTLPLSDTYCLYIFSHSIGFLSFVMQKHFILIHIHQFFCFCYLCKLFLDFIYKKKKIIRLVQFSCSVVSNSLRPHGLQHARPHCPSPTPGVYSNSCPSSQWCHPTISSSVVPFSSCLQSFQASGSFQMSQLFASGGQSIEVSASTSVLAVNTQDWSPLGWTDWISLKSKGFSRVFSFEPQFKSINFLVLSFLYSPTLQSIHDHWKNHSLDQMDLCWQSNVYAF